MNNTIKKFLIGAFASILLVFADQITKYLAYTHLKTDGPIVIIDGVLELRYLTNAGAAWGMLSGQRIFFLLLTGIIILAILYVFIRTPWSKKYAALLWVEILGFSGAVGNFIDRFVNGYVHDFIYFSLIDFPIFNVADSYVVIAAVLLAILFLFVYKDEHDFDFLSLHRK
jgi:signal peptidase II